MSIGVAVLLFGLLSVAAQAEPHRARLSRDLAERVARGSNEPAAIIVSGSPERVQLLAARYGARITKSLRGGAVLEVTGGQLDALTQDPDVDHASGDVRVQRTMAVTTEATGATQVWGTEQLRGFTGLGIGVAVVDSGVATHKALRGRIVASVDFTGAKQPGGDAFGHGTHVAGTIAASNDGGYAGIAPGANIVSLRVLGPDGSGDTSDVINAIDWAVDHRAQYRIRVINLSLGHPVFESYREDPLCLAVQRAVDAGIVVVAAAGNFGKLADGTAVVGGIISPGNSPAALTVGALNTFGTPQRSDDRVATYSSRGPTLIDGVLKPELAAPGNRIVATGAAGSYLAETYPERVVAGRGDNPYMEMSGTSMASAVVAGAVALLLEANPAFTPADTKLALQLTSSRVAGAGLIEAGAGSLNIASAVRFGSGTLASTSIAGEAVEPSSISFVNPATTNIAGWLATAIHLGQTVLSPNTIVWGETIVWADTIVWGETIVWADTIVWGETIVWADTIVWGETIVWGD
jgi:serine protease AprX